MNKLKYVYVHETMEVATDEQLHDLEQGTFDIYYTPHNIDGCDKEGCKRGSGCAEDLGGEYTVYDEPQVIISKSDLRCLVEGHKDISSNDSAYDSKHNSVDLNKFESHLYRYYLSENESILRDIEFKSYGYYDQSEMFNNCYIHSSMKDGSRADVSYYEGHVFIIKIVITHKGDTDKFTFYQTVKKVDSDLTSEVAETFNYEEGFDQNPHEWSVEAWRAGYIIESLEIKKDTWHTASLPSFTNLSDEDRDTVEITLARAMASLEEKGVEVQGNGVHWDGGYL